MSTLLNPEVPAPPAPPAGAPTEPQAPPPAFRDVILAEDGSFQNGWVEKLPEDLKGEAATLARFPKLDELARSYIHARKQLSAKTPTYPGDDAKPEEIAAWRKVAGVPEGPEGYGIKIEGLPEGQELDKDLVQAFAQTAHELHLSPVQAQKLAQWWTAKQGEALGQVSAKQQESIAMQEAQLRREWGDSFDANVRKVKLAAATLGLDLSDPVIGNNIELGRALVKVHGLLGEDKIMRSDEAGLPRSGKEMGMDIINNASNPHHKAYYGKEGPERQAEAAALVQRYLSMR